MRLPSTAHPATHRSSERTAREVFFAILPAAAAIVLFVASRLGLFAA